MTLARRSFITGLISLVAAPAIVRAGSLMPVKSVVWLDSFDDRYGRASDLWSEQQIINMLRRLALSTEPRRAFLANRIAAGQVLK